MPHISFADRFVDPVHEEIDIVVRIGGPDAWASSVGHRYFGSQRLVFCASPEYLAQFGIPAFEHDLEAHRCLGYSMHAGTISPWYFKGRQSGDMERRIMHAVAHVAGAAASGFRGVGGSPARPGHRGYAHEPGLAQESGKSAESAGAAGLSDSPIDAVGQHAVSNRRLTFDA
jgi:DNA-binding transcriptional LysR family regulator